MTAPRHLALIMDGNGRWARSQGLPRLWGHQEGAHSLRRIVEHCRRLELPYLTVFAFSSENWGRPRVEVQGLMALLESFLARETENLRRHHIELAVIGDLARLPEKVRIRLKHGLESTRGLGVMRLTLALSYGGRDELLRAVRRIARQVDEGLLRPEHVSEEHIDSSLDTAGTPPPDLIIRTGGEQRLSNFMLWQSAYTELYFTKTLWPAFGVAELNHALECYANRERRFGRLSNRKRQACACRPAELSTAPGHRHGA
jgi:undecaprenyl diphosphate synthase